MVKAELLTIHHFYFHPQFTQNNFDFTEHYHQ